MKCILIRHGFSKQLPESGVLFLRRPVVLNLGHPHTAILLTPRVKGGVANGVLTEEFTGRNPGFSLAEDTDDLYVGKTLLHGDALMWLMKTLLISRCVNQREAGNLDEMAAK